MNATENTDPFRLQRFLEAQAHCYERVLDELRDGRKTSHWMWFVFPQMRGLGGSAAAQKYAIGSLDEARAYLAHEVLGPRLIECTAIVNAFKGKTLLQIFGTPDDLKFRSSMTLFGRATATEAATSETSGNPDEAILADSTANARSPESALTRLFQAALEIHCEGMEDPLTLELLGAATDADRNSEDEAEDECHRSKAPAGDDRGR